MARLDYLIQDTPPSDKSEAYVLLQAGKGKGKFPSLCINPIGFSYIEGLIWDKFREFKRERKNKILSNEWKRILEGFDLALELMNDNQSTLELTKTLKFNVVRPKYSIDDLLEDHDAFVNMFNEIIEREGKQIKRFTYIE